MKEPALFLNLVTQVGKFAGESMKVRVLGPGAEFRYWGPPTHHSAKLTLPALHFEGHPPVTPLFVGSPPNPPISSRLMSVLWKSQEIF